MIGLRSINTNMKEKHIPLIIKAGLMGLKEIHGRKMIHGDVKAGNILSDGAGKFFLDDVGTTGILYEMYYRTSDPHYFSAPSWFAPEYFRPEVPLTTAIDIWSMGITALELYHGMAPFSNFTPREVVKRKITDSFANLIFRLERLMTAHHNHHVTIQGIHLIDGKRVREDLIAQNQVEQISQTNTDETRALRHRVQE
ncbi:putative Protein kinase superfamily protein [Blattamonas nauphoetae]|uniref:Protein kinase domain-containing protein n=1 Tax=Blattamonas nauphoetae TaxID=2049346 RepID=A0ABQ9YHK1_9EUKA|nr:putative Protein kinase superfamily protein [Blattamonas nauphoetae]